MKVTVEIPLEIPDKLLDDLIGLLMDHLRANPQSLQALLSGSPGAKPDEVSPLAAFSRGLEHAVSQLRVEGTDIEAEALKVKDTAEQVLGEPDLRPALRMYWEGIRCGARSVLEAAAFGREIGATQQPPQEGTSGRAES